MYIGALKFSHSYFNVYVARVAPLGFFYTGLRSAPALLDDAVFLSRCYPVFLRLYTLVLIEYRGVE